MRNAQPDAGQKHARNSMVLTCFQRVLDEAGPEVINKVWIVVWVLLTGLCCWLAGKLSMQPSTAQQLHVGQLCITCFLSYDHVLFLVLFLTS